MSMDSQASEPPRPPTTRTRLALTRKQYLGLPLLATIPVLALFGVFGERRADASSASHVLEMRVRYPSRFRYRQIESLDVTVRNISGRTLDTVSVSIDTAYITRFSNVRIEPAPREPFVVVLIHLRPMESRLVTAELWGAQYGSHSGRISASAQADTVSTLVNTFVFP
jgi:hypothetical protein